ncbi:hypothetical protein, partial [Psychrobacter proteolyticus]|uniref:hypothetical protein n=1 Tax=Psychrobacter proteolyticus TaxID=147825 RepID=UPI0031200331
DNFSPYRTLHLLPKDSQLDKDSIDEAVLNKGALSVEKADPDFSTTSPKPLHIMNMLLLCRSDDKVQPDWSIG